MDRVRALSGGRPEALAFVLLVIGVLALYFILHAPAPREREVVRVGRSVFPSAVVEEGPAVQVRVPQRVPSSLDFAPRMAESPQVPEPEPAPAPAPAEKPPDPPAPEPTMPAMPPIPVDKPKLKTSSFANKDGGGGGSSSGYSMPAPPQQRQEAQEGKGALGNSTPAAIQGRPVREGESEVARDLLPVIRAFQQGGTATFDLRKGKNYQLAPDAQRILEQSAGAAGASAITEKDARAIAEGLGLNINTIKKK